MLENFLDFVDEEAACFFWDVVVECEQEFGKPFTFDKVMGDYPHGMAVLERLGVVTIKQHENNPDEFTVTMQPDAYFSLTYERAMVLKWGEDWMKHRGDFWHEMGLRRVEGNTVYNVLTNKYGRRWRLKRPGLTNEEMMSLAYGDDWRTVERFQRACKASKELKRLRKRERELQQQRKSEPIRWLEDAPVNREIWQVQKAIQKEIERLGTLYLSR